MAGRREGWKHQYLDQIKYVAIALWNPNKLRYEMRKHFAPKYGQDFTAKLAGLFVIIAVSGASLWIFYINLPSRIVQYMSI
jgi:hypothetical protein